MAHYVNHADHDLLVAIVENRKFIQDLTLSAQEHVRVALCKQVIELSKLQPPANFLALPLQPNAASINSRALLHDPRVHEHIFQGVEHLTEAVINTSAALHNQKGN